MMNPKGTLIPIGGNEDKGEGKSESDSLEFIEAGILARVVRESGGSDGLFVIIPTASSIPVEVGELYLDAFHKLGCENVKVLDIRKKTDSEKPESIQLIKEASCIMFSGGDQSKIATKIGGTTIHQILKDRYQNEVDFVIAGTSAGAMAMSTEMIAGGRATESFEKGVVRMSAGLGLTPGVMWDTHFVKRGRFGRTSQAVAKYPTLLAIGLGEDTGVVIKNGQDCTVIGSGMVIVFDGAEIGHNNEAILEEGTPMTLTNLKVHVLSNSDGYNLKTKKVSVLPIDAPYEV
ncbi:MAG: cyanophycinase [Pseudoalteromonas distincta]|jgi:cyanophycinase